METLARGNCFSFAEPARVVVIISPVSSKEEDDDGSMLIVESDWVFLVSSSISLFLWNS